MAAAPPASRRIVFVTSNNPGDRASIGSALEEARRFDRARVDMAGVRSWDDLADQLGRGAASRKTQPIP